jgi:TolB protein
MNSTNSLIGLAAIALFSILPDSATLAAEHPLQGTQFLITSTRTGDTEIFVIDPVLGDAQNLSRSPQSEDRYPCWSPDGKQVAFTSDRDGTMNLYVMNANGTDVKQLTTLKAPAVAYMPSWSGERIVFGLHAEKPEMASIRANGTDLQMLGLGHDPSLSPDGKMIVYTGECPGGVSVFTMRSDGSEKKQIVAAANPWGAIFPAWSPNGQRIAYAFKVGNALEIFTCDADGENIKQVTKLGQISTPPAWSPDGRWISFRHTDERYWSNPERMKIVYAERPGDKRPVWIVRPDGSDAQLVEVTRYGCAMDGSRAQWRP